jgi:hypothetical protein
MPIEVERPMSTLREVNDLIERMRRLIRRTEVMPGQGEVWTAEVPGHGIQTYRLTGMKSPAEIEDDLSSLAVWVWSTKDHLKKLVQSRGGDPADVERYVDSSPDLRVCADIANTAKHAQLNRSRTGRYLRAGRPQFEVPQAALGSLTFLENEVRVDVSKPELVRFRYPLLDEAGKETGDAMKHLEGGIAAWEKYVEQIR